MNPGSPAKSNEMGWFSLSAKKSDDGRVLEMYRIILETEERIRELGLNEDCFLSDESVKGRMNADGIFMCVYRVTEEAGNMSPETKAAYPEIPWRAIRGMRNIFAHDYGKLDRRMVWNAATRDFKQLKDFCLTYGKANALDI